MIKHIAIFVWSEQATQADIDRIGEDLGELPAQIDALVDYTFGPDLGLTEGNGDFAVIATVPDEEGLRAYQQHPAHVPVAQRIRELAKSRVAVQISAS